MLTTTASPLALLVACLFVLGEKAVQKSIHLKKIHPQERHLEEILVSNEDAKGNLVIEDDEHIRVVAGKKLLRQNCLNCWNIFGFSKINSAVFVLAASAALVVSLSLSLGPCSSLSHCKFAGDSSISCISSRSF